VCVCVCRTDDCEVSSNILLCCGLENDPRRVGNLIDGVQCTCDDMHAWLAPFTKGSSHIVAMKFDTVILPFSRESRYELNFLFVVYIIFLA
jgi:hypothetical protein